MSILTRKKTTQEYKEKLASLPTNTRENIQAAINGFTRFVNQKYQSTPDKICEELITIKKTEGDEEAHVEDIDYVTAMQYGMPPTGGLGVGIDRVVMLAADQSSIREVIAFPHMKPE